MDLNGRKTWVESDELAYTIGEPSEDLRVETLNYLATSSLQKAVYQEHSIDDGETGGSKKKDKTGRQRGFIVRVEQDEKTRVAPCFQAAADRLITDKFASRIDVTESTTEKRSRKKRSKEQPTEEATETQSTIELSSLASNECRIETTARCTHNAHGDGFEVLVAEGGTLQKLHIFTGKAKLSAEEWYKGLVDAAQSAGCRVMLAKLAPDPMDATDTSKAAAKDEAQAAESDWLDAVMGRCMIDEGKKQKEESSSKPGEDSEVKKDESSEAPKPKTKKAVPPWLRV